MAPAFALAAGRRIAIAGAGSIGCYIGGCLALAGRPVTLLLRPAMAARLAGGLALSDLDGRDRQVAPDGLRCDTDPAAALADAGLVLVTVKGGDSGTIADLIAAHAPPDAPVLSLQNGIGNTEILTASLPGRPVLAGMVPFNVVQRPDGRFHRGTDGMALIADTLPGLAPLLDVPGLPLSPHADMASVLWGKLLLNLNNALNALSGLPLAQQLAVRGWRQLLAAQQREALALLRLAGIRPVRLTRLPPGWLPSVLDLPDPLFRRLAGSMLRIDPHARSSMWEDLQRGRPTEIDLLQGAVLRLAERLGGQAPVCARVRHHVKQAETAGGPPPGLTPAAILDGV